MELSRRLLLVLVVWSLACCWGGCSNSTIWVEADTTKGGITLSGTVVTLETEVPISGASVEILGFGPVTATDTRGEFRVESLAPGSYACILSAPGHLSVQRTLDLDSLQKAETYHAHFNFVLPTDSRRLTLQFISASDALPISGVNVSVVMVPFPERYGDLQLVGNEVAFTAIADGTGLAVLERLPNWEVILDVEGVDQDGDGHDDLVGQGLLLDLRALPMEPKTITLFPTDTVAPRVVNTNVSNRQIAIGPVLYFEFDQAMNTDLRLTLFEISSSSNALPVRVSWESENRLEMSALKTGENTWNARMQAFSKQGLSVDVSTYVRWNVDFVEFPGEGDCEERVGDLAVLNQLADLDYDTRDFTLSWSAAICAGAYRIYARDNWNNPGWTFLAAYIADFNIGNINTTVRLPEEFDRFYTDRIITPLTGTVVEFCVVPDNAAMSEPGAPHEIIEVRDLMPPHIVSAEQLGPASTNSNDPIEFEIIVRFSEGIGDFSVPPVLEIQEAGGDPDFALDPDAATWTWNEDLRSGSFRILIENGQDASGDLYQVSSDGVQDLSGNVSTEYPPTPAAEIFRAYYFDFEDGPGDWSLDGVGWEHGIPTVGPFNVYSGDYCWGTILNGEYSNSMDASLISPVMKLNFPNAELSFYTWSSIEYLFDHFLVQIDNGAGWTTIWSINGNHSSWTRQVLDLSEFEGDEVRIRFRLTTNISGTSIGAFVDLVEVLPGH